ncbi:MAG: polysaccharide biosynthesis/export family protein [Flavobacteriaceae bacterium]|nr:polysaccharide biosynthesis/export family protein [Flavobacteriaceae bacterium]
MFSKKITIIILFLNLLLVSCVSKQKILYIQDTVTNNSNNSFELKLEPDDMLLINVTSENPEIAEPYNLKSVTLQNNTEEDAATRKQLTYLIDKNGYIDFPIVGKIKIGGLTKEQATNEIQNILKDHVKDALVTIRLVNFKITVLGEVQKPGTYTIKSERITLLEALGMAGDLTIYGKRSNVLLIREQNGEKITHRIDLTKSSFFDSPYYYLAQNDVLYVEPNGTKVNSSAIGPNLTVGISALSLIVTIIALTTR